MNAQRPLNKIHYMLVRF